MRLKRRWGILRSDSRSTAGWTVGVGCPRAHPTWQETQADRWGVGWSTWAPRTRSRSCDGSNGHGHGYELADMANSWPVRIEARRSQRHHAAGRGWSRPGIATAAARLVVSSFPATLPVGPRARMGPGRPSGRLRRGAGQLEGRHGGGSALQRLHGTSRRFPRQKRDSCTRTCWCCSAAVQCAGSIVSRRNVVGGAASGRAGRNRRRIVDCPLHQSALLLCVMGLWCGDGCDRQAIVEVVLIKQ